MSFKPEIRRNIYGEFLGYTCPKCGHGVINSSPISESDQCQSCYDQMWHEECRKDREERAEAGQRWIKERLAALAGPPAQHIELKDGEDIPF